LDAFIMACGSVGAMPVDAVATDLRITLHCTLPHVFTPRDREYVGLGVSFSNSDFGAGSFRIDLNVTSLRNGHVMPLRTLNGDGRGESHNGGNGDDSITDSTELSEQTIQKQVVAKQSEVRDIVLAALSPGKVNELLDQVADAMDHKISWHTFERFLRGKLVQEELEVVQGLMRKSGRSEFLPEVQYDGDGQAIMDLWFASNVIGHVANKCTDAVRKEELQQAAGKLLVTLS